MFNLSCHLGKNQALVSSNIVVTPFLDLSCQDKAKLNKLFSHGHLSDGAYFFWLVILTKAPEPYGVWIKINVYPTNH